MIRLGLRLALRSGREGLVRLVIMTVAVGIGVAMLLGVLAEFHAFQAQSSQPCWSCTQGATPVPQPLPARGDLWNNSVDLYRGQTIARLDVAALGPSAPVPPGISALPAPGTYDASPALAALLKSVPANQLGDRFPGRLAETIGNAALTGPGELVVYVGYSPSALAPLTGTQVVDSIATAPAPEIFTPFFRYAFGVGVLAVLFPILVLISTATRLAADRREERFAALRLVGGTPGDVRAIAAAESVLSALSGTAVGIVVFLLVRPLLAGAAVITPYFPASVMPTWWEFAGILIAVPATASVAALISLRRVEVSPLGVARRTTPEPPAARRLIPLAVGAGLYVL
ncbi:MAG TPA: FtsX-like permease family protein, partial [Trebonia sp.]